MKRYIYLLIIGFVTLFFYHFLKIREPLDVNTDNVLKIQLIEPPTAANNATYLGSTEEDDKTDGKYNKVSASDDKEDNCKYLISEINSNTSGLMSYNKELIEAQKKIGSINQLIAANKKSFHYNEEIMKAFIKEQHKGAQDASAKADAIKME
jgi:hypothetical protein